MTCPIAQHSPGLPTDMEHFARHDMLNDAKINAEIAGQRLTHLEYTTMFRMSETKNML
jgi:hypothetical protein